MFQETSATLWQKFDEFQPGSNFFAWACRIAYFEVLEFRRRRRRQRLTFNEGLLETLSRDLSERQGICKPAAWRCRIAWNGSRSWIEELVEQRYAGGETILEIAQRTGRPVHALYKAFGRIRRALMKCIDDTVGDTGERPRNR